MKFYIEGCLKRELFSSDIFYSLVLLFWKASVETFSISKVWKYYEADIHKKLMPVSSESL